jgi:hypothetical protein
MERFRWIIDEILKQFETIERALSSLMAKLPYIGTIAAENSNLIILTFVIVLTVFILKPLVKWSLGILIIGSLLAGIISHFSGLTFWGVLPITALGAGIVMFTNRFTMR